MRSSLLLLGSLLLPALAGCATVRSDFTPSTGEKLTVYDKAIQRAGIQQMTPRQKDSSIQGGSLENAPRMLS